MKLLAVDTATSILTVALCDDKKLLAETILQAGRKHSERLLSTVEWLLNQANTTLKDLDALAVSIGPGSFTGLRIGAATWKGLAMAEDLPLVAVPTLDAMSRLAGIHDGLVCTMLDARMNEVFTATYRFENGTRTKCIEDTVCPVETILEQIQDSNVTFLGDGVDIYRPVIEQHLPDARFLPSHLSVPHASAIALEAFDMLSAGHATDAAQVEPVYLRKSQAEINLAQKQKQDAQ